MLKFRIFEIKVLSLCSIKHISPFRSPRCGVNIACAAGLRPDASPQSIFDLLNGCPSRRERLRSVAPRVSSPGCKGHNADRAVSAVGLSAVVDFLFRDTVLTPVTISVVKTPFFVEK